MSESLEPRHISTRPGADDQIGAGLLSAREQLGRIASRYAPEVETALRDAIPSDDTTRELYNILRYHLGWFSVDSEGHLHPARTFSGKMLRPTLCLLACEAVGAHYRRALPAAAAVELLHNFSLIHDDVEDRSRERRGRRTVWDVWGEPVAVNAGDAMLILSQLALLRAPTHGVDPAVSLLLVRIMNQTCLALCEGQHLDLAEEGNPHLSHDGYLRVIQRKTAALIGCSMQLGALSGGVRPAIAERYRAVGEKLGLAFQIQDDVLGIWGDPAETGKPAAEDVYNRKPTLPVIDAIERANPSQHERLIAIYSSPRPTDQEVAEAVAILDALGTRARADAVAERYVSESIDELRALEPVPGPGAELKLLAAALVRRSS